MDQSIIDQLIQKLVSTFQITYKEAELSIFNVHEYVVRLMEGAEIITTLSGADKKKVVVGAIKALVGIIKIKEGEKDIILAFVNGGLLEPFIDVVIFASKNLARLNVPKCCKDSCCCKCCPSKCVCM